MKVIADTNIWYYLGQENDLFKKVEAELIAPNYVNIFELSKTENLIDKEELTRSATQKLFHYKSHVIYEPPLHYMGKLATKIPYEHKELNSLLEFSSRFASGHSIKEEEKENFRAWLQTISTDLQKAADFFNAEAENIKKKIEDKKKHKDSDTLQLTGGFLNFLVEKATEGKMNLKGFDLNNTELLIKTLDHYFKTLETSGMKMQANDWFDFSILAYVQPGDKYWTREKRWINLIKQAGCESYLYPEPK